MAQHAEALQKIHTRQIDLLGLVQAAEVCHMHEASHPNAGNALAALLMHLQAEAESIANDIEDLCK